jgi:hypothetical protein
MEKRGVIDRDTPDTEEKLPAGQKQADTKRAAERAGILDNDFTKRAADAAAEKLNQK